MVPMMVRIENMGQRPAQPDESRRNRSGDRGIDRGNRARFWLAQEMDVIVVEDGKRMDLEGHGKTLTPMVARCHRPLW
jgi:hypothetical protein